jgi:very-short-patch-repair endonuclease
MRFLAEDDPRRQVWERCESPIEEIFCVILFVDLRLKAVAGDFSAARVPDLLCDVPTAFVFSQQEIVGYRVDFLIVIADQEGCVLYAIECDGRDFHSSEDQRLYDERRDAALRLAGCRKVLRFSGRSIVRHPREVAAYLRAFLGDLAGIEPDDCHWYREWLATMREPESRLCQAMEALSREQFEEELAAIRREDAAWM